MKCECEGWRQNIEKLNAPLLRESARSGGAVQYDGAPFRFCPWCGTPLVTDSPEQRSLDQSIRAALRDADKKGKLNVVAAVVGYPTGVKGLRKIMDSVVPMDAMDRQMLGMFLSNYDQE